MKKLFSRFSAAVISGIIAAVTLIVPVSAETGTNNQKVIALTFDDGPNTTVTPQILDLFEEYDGHATFFLIGQNINSSSAVSVKKAYEMGCEIANHTKSHTYLTDKSAAEMLEEVDYVDNLVYDITGEKTKFVRAPFLNMSESVFETIDHTFISGVMIEDVSTDPAVRAAEILKVAKDGQIILMHDSEANQPTVDALKIAMPELVKQGYKFVTVSELFELQGETPRGDMCYSEVTRYPCSGYTEYSSIYSGAAASLSDKGNLDTKLFTELNSFAVQVDYTSASVPQIVLQKWGGNQFWKSVSPVYSNGSRAVFMSEDILSAIEESGVNPDELNQFCISPSGTDTTVTGISILVPSSDGTSSGTVTALKGDLNDDKKINSADYILMIRYFLGDSSVNINAADMNNDKSVNIIDPVILKSEILS